MRAVLDTNVLMSGIFFGGVPGQILEAWYDGHFELVLSPSVFEEYRRVALVVSGDQHLLDVTGYRGVRVVTPRQFLDERLPR